MTTISVPRSVSSRWSKGSGATPGTGARNKAKPTPTQMIGSDSGRSLRRSGTHAVSRTTAPNPARTMT
jgi:hypothetical protein